MRSTDVELPEAVEEDARRCPSRAPRSNEIAELRHCDASKRGGVVAQGDPLQGRLVDHLLRAHARRP